MLEKLAALPPNFFSGDGKRLSPLAYVFLLMLCFAFFTPGMVTMPPTDRDESSFAQASKQMVETGNYTDIKLQDAPRYKKPIGIYWLQSLSVRALSPHHLNQIWAYRIPSFLGAAVAVLMTAALGNLLFGAAAGLLGAVMLAGCVLLNAEARLATTDAALLACIMMAMYGLARAYLGQVSGWRMPVLFWTALAAGVLIKGPIILLPVCAVLLWLRVSEKNLAWFRALHPRLGVLYALALVLPWFIAIVSQSHGAFLRQSAGQDMLAKLWQGQNRGMMMPGLHLVALPVLFFPYALFVLLAMPDAWKNRQDPAVKFCLGWIIPTWIVFEISLTKLPHYVLPTYPALALLAAKFLLDGFPSAAKGRRIPLAVMITVWLLVGAGLGVALATLPAISDGIFLWPQIVVGIVLFLAQPVALMLLMRDRSMSVVALTIGMLVFLTVTFGDTLPRLQHLWMSREIVEAADGIAGCPHARIVSVGYHEPSLVFLAGTATLLPMSGGDAAALMKQQPCRVAVIDRADIPSFVDAFGGGAQQPFEAGTISGLNAGHGSKAMLTLYGLRPAPVQP